MFNLLGTVGPNFAEKFSPESLLKQQIFQIIQYLWENAQK